MAHQAIRLALPVVTSLTLLILASSCTSTSQSSGTAGALAGFTTASVEVKEDYSGDPTLRRAITDQLRMRGLKAADTKSAAGGRHLVVRYADSWTWDLVMYLRELDIDFVDAGTGSSLATASYQNSFIHSYPDQHEVVSRLFKDLDTKGLFKKAR